MVCSGAADRPVGLAGIQTERWEWVLLLLGVEELVWVKRKWWAEGRMQPVVAVEQKQAVVGRQQVGRGRLGAEQMPEEQQLVQVLVMFQG